MKKKSKRLNWIVGIVIAFFIIGIGAAIGVYQLFEAEKTSLSAPSAKDQAREEFLGTIGETAREVAANHDLYASVMIAQASLESHFGTSGLGSSPNFNLYGIKGQYENKSVQFDTQEDDGKGNMTTVKADFRKYPSYEASMDDYANLLAKGTSWDPTIYKEAFKTNARTYLEATNALTGTYATDSSYEEKLNALIVQYHLDAYDTVATKKTIEAGFFDNVEDVAATYEIEPTLIRQWNHLKSNELKKGDQLVLYIPVTD